MAPSTVDDESRRSLVIGRSGAGDEASLSVYDNVSGSIRPGWGSEVVEVQRYPEPTVGLALPYDDEA